ncbi:ribonucleoside triphosphate reductase [Candidatus Gottesmanbacteria bacterium]|nr:ribonucleoside triphosphate reductase [Candidatus Gottesmanbacteria bacterium]MBI5465040.1 ribonucleoside triphosphate reductase [Candidatus Gottesmanbacteria bacterium]
MKLTITKIRKRSGRIVKFNPQKIANAIDKAFKAIGEKNGERVKFLADRVVEKLEEKYDGRRVPGVEEIQDIVEEILMKHGHYDVARAYILYRDLRTRVRDIHSLVDSDELVGDYLSKLDWRVRENSNMAYSLQGLNNHVASVISANYWLNKIYPPPIREAHVNGDLHIHNLQILAAYCCGWDLRDLLWRGFGGVPGKIECKPAKHFRTALGQLVNFFYTLQGESAGAQAVSNFDTLLAPFIAFDNLSYKEVKQALQEFVFNMNVPTRVGFQTPFSNVTLDLNIPRHLTKEPAIIGGKPQNKAYGDFQEQVDQFNKAFAEVMLEGDAKGRVFTFPIPTYNITRDFAWENPVYEGIWEMTRKYGIPYFSNFINSDMKPEDARSMCCRLRLDTRELSKRGGGLFGSYPLTGSLGVITLNMARVGYLSKSKKGYFERLSHLMDLAKEALLLKRVVVERFTEEGLYPYSKVYLGGIKDRFGEYWKNHFNTIGLIGMNESLLNFIGKNIGEEESRAFALEVLDFMRTKLLIYQKETDQMFNLEATPAEGTSYNLAKQDKKTYPEIICANEEEVKKGKAEPYYTNSTHLPVNFTDDIFEALNLQDEFQTKYTGGTVLHGFLGESMADKEAVKSLVKKIAQTYHLPYYTLTPTFSVCPSHGYLKGEVEKCPKCGKTCEVWSRIVGYLRPVVQWNAGKQAEFGQRETYNRQLHDI